MRIGAPIPPIRLGMVTDNRLYFRVDDENRAAFREAEAFPPLRFVLTLRIS